MSLIALSGKRGTGKTYLYEEYLQPLGFQPVTMAEVRAWTFDGWKAVVFDVHTADDVHDVNDKGGAVIRIYAPDRAVLAIPDALNPENDYFFEEKDALDAFDIIGFDPKGQPIFGTTVTEIVNGREKESALYDAVIDNRTFRVPDELDQQMTSILTVFDVIKPGEQVYGVTRMRETLLLEAERWTGPSLGDNSHVYSD